jgi:DNA-binding transcriptional LysR family regulator
MDVLRLTLRQLQIFVAVANSGSTIAGGERIALSQSATSSAINELERLLSLKLFDRVGKHLLLNDNGRTLLPRALSMLDGAFEIERLGSDGGAQLQALSIGASTTIGNHVLPGLLRNFLSQQPANAAAWQSKVIIENTAQICDRVAEFAIDIGLIEGTCHRPELSANPWLRDELVVVAAPERLKGPRGATQGVDSKLLRQAVWLLRETGSGTRQMTDLALLPHIHSYQRSIELGSSEAIKHAAAEGLGFACLSRWVVDDLLRSKHLCIVKTALPPMFRQCYWVMHRHKQPTSAMQRMIEFVEQSSSGRDPAQGSAD